MDQMHVMKGLMKLFILMELRNSRYHALRSHDGYIYGSSHAGRQGGLLCGCMQMLPSAQATPATLNN
jgi:hypothetical protein